MVKKFWVPGLAAAAFLIFNVSIANADERDAEISALKIQVQELLKRIEALEQGQTREKEALAKPQQEEPFKKSEPSVSLEKLTEKLKLKGRFAAGYFDSGKAGSYPAGSFEIPDAKIQLSFQPDEINKIVMRMNLNNATFNSVDYSYLETDLTKLLDLNFALGVRIGRIRLDFGEETLTNNPVDGILPSNSASNVDGKDEGLQLYGKLGKDMPLGYAFSVTNGPTGTGSDVSASKAFTGKLWYNILDPLSVSTSYFNSGSLKSSSSEMSIAGLSSRPDNALRWSREIWEVDLRYDFKKADVSGPAVFSDSRAILQTAYGIFSDDVSSGATPSEKRDGEYGFVEGLYNFNKKFYLAGRFSIINLGGDMTASLNNITANKYRRYSLGAGYRLRENVILKLSYDWNRESGEGVSDTDNDLLSAVATARF